MSKIFETQFEKGSLIDAIENRILTPTGTVILKRTDKGTASLFDGGISDSGARLESEFQITTIPFTVVVNFKFIKSSSTGYFVSQTRTNDSGRFIIDIQADDKLEYFLGGDSFKTDKLVNNKWYQAIFTRDGDGVCRFYLDNKYLGTYTNNNALPLSNVFQIGGSSVVVNRTIFGYINKVIVYDGEISTVQREKHYREFLQSQPIEKPVRGFELVKPTDLSYQKDRGLLAAYNFKRNGDTLVDISGNGLNFTIPSGIHQNKDYLTFYNSDFIGIKSSPRTLTLTDAKVAGRLNFTGNFTVMVRARVKSHSDFQGLVVKGTSSAGWRCYIDGANNQMRANLGNQVVSPPTAHTTMGNWNTFVYIFRPGTNIGFWLNGIDLGSQDITATITTTNNNFIIGALQNNIFPADADFAEVRIYNRELSEQEIKDYHNSFIKPVILEDWSGSAVGDVI